MTREAIKQIVQLGGTVTFPFKKNLPDWFGKK